MVVINSRLSITSWKHDWGIVATLWVNKNKKWENNVNKMEKVWIAMLDISLDKFRMKMDFLFYVANRLVFLFLVQLEKFVIISQERTLWGFIHLSWTTLTKRFD